VCARKLRSGKKPWTGAGLQYMSVAGTGSSFHEGSRGFERKRWCCELVLAIVLELGLGVVLADVGFVPATEVLLEVDDDEGELLIPVGPAPAPAPPPLLSALAFALPLSEDTDRFPLLCVRSIPPRRLDGRRG
jgi:hypothetical protein